MRALLGAHRQHRSILQNPPGHNGSGCKKGAPSENLFYPGAFESARKIACTVDAASPTSNAMCSAPSVALDGAPALAVEADPAFATGTSEQDSAMKVNIILGACSPE